MPGNEFSTYTTLLGKSDALTYMEDVVRSHQTPEKRRETLHFLKVLTKLDQESVRLLTQEHIGHTSKLKQLEEEVSHERALDIFANDPLSVAAIQAEMASTANTKTTLYLDGIQFGASDQVLVKGTDREFLAHATGTALLSSLSLTNSFPTIEFEDAHHIVIKGFKFDSDSTVEKTVSFIGLASYITFENCVFSSAGHADSKFWHGGDGFLEAAVTIKNCWITGYTSWMNFDLTTSSATPTSDLSNVVITGCVFYNVMGSAAIRGRTIKPTGTVTIKNNKWIWDDAFVLHQYFWSAIEVNNCSKVYIEDNQFIGKPSFKTTGTGYRGAVQVWNKSGEWNLVFKNNTIHNFNVGLQLAMGNVGSTALFYGFDDSSSSFTEIDQGTCVGVLNFASLVYPWTGNDSSNNPATWQVLDGDKDPTITNLTLPVVTQASHWVAA